MKMYTSSEQTAKLIELGFEKPKGLADAEPSSGKWVREAYSIGELIEILNRVDDEKLEICRDCGFWLVGTDLYCIPYRELIDALYDMITLLKERGMV